MDTLILQPGTTDSTARVLQGQGFVGIDLRPGVPLAEARLSDPGGL